MCNDNTSSFIELLKIDNSVSVHYGNMQILAAKIYKFISGSSPKLISDYFKLYV